MWSRKHIEVLIEMYRANPCLYAPKHSMYKNRNARNEAMKEIASEVCKSGLKVSEIEIKTKFNNLRTNFLNQHRKYFKSFKSGASIDDVNKPTIWYYDLMLFIAEHCIPRPSEDSLSAPQVPSKSFDVQDEEESDKESLDANLIFEYEDTQEDTDDGHETIKIISDQDIRRPNETAFASGVSDATPSTSKSSYQRNKRKRSEPDNNSFDKAANVLENLTSILDKDESKQPKSGLQIFGEFVATQLEYVESDEELLCEAQQQIANIIWSVKRKKISQRRV